MSINIQAYFDTIKKKTGKTPEDFKELADKKGLMAGGTVKPTVKASEVYKWLKDDFELGRGHAQALFHFFKQKTE